MQERARAINGEFLVRSVPDQGTQIVVQVRKADMTISVFLADDHRVLRDGLRVLLESQNDIKVVGEAENGNLAIEGITSTKPNIAVMDITMPELNGIEAAQIIHGTLPEIGIVILSIHSDLEHIFRALQAGAQGYLLKESAGSEVISAVRAVYLGRRYLSPEHSGNSHECSFGKPSGTKSS